jgi:Protein of unknown function (DUF1549)/Protein of unknown function (DUF1553)/Planctomycete cytochrome C
MRIATTAFVCLIAVGVGRGQAPDAKGIEFFETKIRPVLVEQCYRCHSADAAKAKKLRGGLLLDTKAGLLKGGDSGPALVPGKSKEGQLLAALRYDGDVKMPPTKKLPAETISDFAKWIDMGAPDPRQGETAKVAARKIDIDEGKKFWAFRPLAASPPPDVKNPSWAKSPIDRFILSKLDAKGLTPNAPASREKLIRRAYFDLSGLPPTPAQIDAFVKDPAPDAYAKLVDELLAGPAYGERWARHWLDIVRFAESGGYEFDGNRPGAYHYRDWVIKALNQDMPYDQFVRTQIAGDVLKPGDYDAASATGFLVAGPYPGQTTSKTLALIRYNHLDDMVSTIGSGMLGLTIGCARCHDHKYDPLPQQDYYRLVADLGRTDSTNAKLDPHPEIYRKAKEHFDAVHAPLNAAIAKFEKEQLPGRAAAWFAKAGTAPAPTWMILDLALAKGKTPLRKLPDGSAKPVGKIEKTDTITLVAQTYQKNLKAFRIEALADREFPKSGPGLEGDGGFVLTDVTVQATPISAKGKMTPVKLRGVDGKTAWSVPPSEHGKDVAAQFDIVGDLGDAAGLQLTITMKFDPKQGAIGRPRVSLSTQAEPRTLTAASEFQNAQEAATILRASEGKTTAANLPIVARWFRPFDAEYDALHKASEEMLDKVPVPEPKLVEVFAAQGNRGGEVHFLIRGEVERKGPKADPGYIQVLSRSDEKPAKTIDPRVALADWLTNVDAGAGPLLARVIANRLWQHHFGRGIVATPNDFGLQGEAPTHPELLDHLAQELIRGGWKLKPLHRQIMLSAAYMQAGDIPPEALKLDPTNRLWSHRPPLRLEAEVVRDALLAVGGSLDRTPFGPGSLDVNSPRRSIYLTVKRSQPVAMLQMMDAPEAIQSIGERSRTTVPTQSLAFMNSPLVRKQADNLAKLLSPIAARNVGDAVDQAYLTVLGRRPAAVERERMLSFLDRQTASYGHGGRDQAVGDCCQVLLCLNEFVYVD